MIYVELLDTFSLILTDVLPIGAPWGGSEVLSFLSALTSFIFYEWHKEKRLSAFPVYCVEGEGICRMEGSMEGCGKCATPPLQRQHQTYYQHLVVVSGLGAATLHNPQMDTHIEPILHSHLSIYSPDILSLLGYSYTRLCPLKADKHLDEGIPVFLRHKDTCRWYLVTGYDKDGRLCGYDGRECVTCWENWPDFIGEALLLRKEPHTAYSVSMGMHLFQDALLRTVTAAENEKLAVFLEKDALFADIPPTALQRIYDYLVAVISFYAGSRLCSHHVLHNHFWGMYPRPLSFSCLEEAAACFLEIHRLCFWNIFYIMDYKFLPPSRRTLELFRKKSTRHKLAEYLRAIEESDRQAYGFLQGI